MSNNEINFNKMSPTVDMKYFEFMQYVGLEDKNKTPIFESDIVFCDDRSFNHIVEWDCDRAMFRLVPIGKANYYAIEFNIDMIIESNLIVIGNICENRELLK